MIYGKLFRKMFHGSMVGSGAPVFAVMSYVVSHMSPARDREEYVTLNPIELGAILGERVEVVEEAIGKLCAVDAMTDTPGHEGRRIEKRSGYEYWVVNGRYYREMIDEEDRREKAAVRQRRHRERVEMERTRMLGKKLRGIREEKEGVVAGGVEGLVGGAVV